MDTKRLPFKKRNFSEFSNESSSDSSRKGSSGSSFSMQNILENGNSPNPHKRARASCSFSMESILEIPKIQEVQQIRCKQQTMQKIKDEPMDLSMNHGQVFDDEPQKPRPSLDMVHLIFFHNGDQEKCRNSCEVGLIPAQPEGLHFVETPLYEILENYVD